MAEERFIRSNISPKTSYSFVVGPLIEAREHSNLALDVVLQNAKEKSTEEKWDYLDKAAKFLKTHAHKLGIKIE